MNNYANIDRIAASDPIDILTIGDLLDALIKLDRSMWVCATVEGHSYPLTIGNAGILETSKVGNCEKELQGINLFFLDINHKSFLGFLEAEIINPIRKTQLQ